MFKLRAPLKKNKKYSNENGSYYVEYAILLGLATVFISLADLTPFLQSYAEQKTHTSNINQEAYYTVPAKLHPNQIQKISVINYSENLISDYEINKESSNLLWSIIKGILKVFGVEFNDTYYMNTIKLGQNSNYVIDIMDPEKTVVVNNTVYSLSDFKFTYVVYADKENVANNSGNIKDVDWPVDIASNDKSNQQLLFTFSNTSNKWSDEVSTALSSLLKDNLLVKEKSITYVNQ